jgi:hypothetical protein
MFLTLDPEIEVVGEAVDGADTLRFNWHHLSAAGGIP